MMFRQLFILFFLTVVHSKPIEVYLIKNKKINSTPKTQFSELRFSELLDLLKKPQLPFSYFTLCPDSI